ncbi:hypothetical protein HKX48_004560 [Thoreauomyces humboldtii]|nr:hypothetical protein HKX48_004560 [Thoreauomyces humboldtii]
MAIVDEILSDHESQWETDSESKAPTTTRRHPSKSGTKRAKPSKDSETKLIALEKERARVEAESERIASLERKRKAAADKQASEAQQVADLEKEAARIEAESDKLAQETRITDLKARIAKGRAANEAACARLSTIVAPTAADPPLGIADVTRKRKPAPLMSSNTSTRSGNIDMLSRKKVKTTVDINTGKINLPDRKSKAKGWNDSAEDEQKIKHITMRNMLPLRRRKTVTDEVHSEDEDNEDEDDLDPESEPDDFVVAPSKRQKVDLSKYIPELLKSDGLLNPTSIDEKQIQSWKQGIPTTKQFDDIVIDVKGPPEAVFMAHMTPFEQEAWNVVQKQSAELPKANLLELKTHTTILSMLRKALERPAYEEMHKAFVQAFLTARNVFDLSHAALNTTVKERQKAALVAGCFSDVTVTDMLETSDFGQKFTQHLLGTYESAKDIVHPLAKTKTLKKVFGKPEKSHGSQGQQHGKDQPAAQANPETVVAGVAATPTADEGVSARAAVTGTATTIAKAMTVGTRTTERTGTNAGTGTATRA